MQSSMNYHLERGHELHRLGKYDLAIREAHLAAGADSTSAEPHILLAWIFHNQGRSYAAIRAARTALALAPNDSDAHYMHAITLWGAQQTRAAEQAFGRALALPSADAWNILTNYARFLVACERFEDALTAADEAVRQVPDHHGPHESCAMALLRLERYAEAEAAIATVLRINPRSLLGFELLGDVRLAQGRAEEAADAYREQLRIDPRDRSGRLKLIRALKAHYRVYRIVLMISRPFKRRRTKRMFIWGIFLSAAFIMAMLVAAVVAPTLAGIFLSVALAIGGPLVIVFVVSGFWEDVGEPIFNTLLALDPPTREVINFNNADAVWTGGILLTLVGVIIAVLASALRGPTAHEDIQAGLGMTVMFGFLSLFCASALAKRKGQVRTIMLSAIILGALCWVLSAFPLTLIGRDSMLTNVLSAIGLIGWATAMLVFAVVGIIGAALKR